MSMLLVNVAINEVDKRRRRAKKGNMQQATAVPDDAAAVCSTPEGQAEQKAIVDSTPAVVVIDADFDDEVYFDSNAVSAEVPQKAELGMALLMLRIVSVLLCSVMSLVAFICLVGITWTTLGSASLVLVALAAPMAVSQVRGLHSRWHKALDEALGGSVGETSGQAWDNSFI